MVFGVSLADTPRVPHARTWTHLRALSPTRSCHSLAHQPTSGREAAETERYLPPVRQVASCTPATCTG